MAHPRPQSRDLGAALSGLLLGGSMIFLIMLTIVWLTNSHFAGEKAEKARHEASVEAPVTSAPAAPVAPGPGVASPAPDPKR